MIAQLVGVPPESKDPETNGVRKHINELKNKMYEQTSALGQTISSKHLPYDTKLIEPQKVSENYYPIWNLMTVGILISVIGVLLFSPLQLPSMYRYIGGIFCFILGISIIGSGILSRVLEFIEKRTETNSR